MLYEFVKEALTEEEVKKMLIEKTADGLSVRQCASKYSNETTKNDLGEVLKKIFSDKEMEQFH